MTNKKIRPEFTKLTLGGYQTFEEVSEFPLGRITFLLGPNSAGKSAVEDGFNLFSELIKTKGGLAITGVSGFDRIKSHLRRISDSPLKYSKFLTIGLSANIVTKPYRAGFYTLQQQFDEAVLSSYLAKREVHVIEYQARFRINEDLDPEALGPWFTGHDIEFRLNELSILKVHNQHRIGLNLSHPFLKAFGILQNVGRIPKNINHVASLDKGWMWIAGGFQVQQDGTIEDQFSESEDLKMATAKALAEFPDFKPTLEKILISLHDLFEVKFSLVPASRTTPLPKDLLFFSDAPIGFSKENNFNHELQMEKFPIPSVGQQKYRCLAESLIASATTKQAEWSKFYDDYIRDTSGLGDCVNRALSEHLFLERGYRVAADYRLLLSNDQYEELKGFNSLTPGDFPVITRLYLVDSQGREFSFMDVGSGLGYVLPVLISLYGTERVSIIQQPELHLHPALQASMGDVLIDASNNGKQVIVETHSEHMLLRVLRRIRQTSSGTLTDAELAISSDDISILYFNPSPDGTTRVSQIRVSPEGEFLDRWPRGFFAERDAELFDE